MNASDQIRQWQAAAKTRRLLVESLIDLPLLVALYLLASRFLSVSFAIALTLASAAILLLYVTKSITALDKFWLIRQLDLRLQDLEDSSDLLFKQPADLSPLQNLQRGRIEQRIGGMSDIDLREDWNGKKILACFLIAASLAGFAIYWPQAKTANDPKLAETLPAGPTNEIPILLVDKSIRIQAPAYTGLPARSEKNLQLKFPEGSTLSWNLKFNPQPVSVDLLFHDGKRLALKKNGEFWQGSKAMLQSSLYRLQINNAPLKDDRLYRLDAIKDIAPQIRVIQPDRNLSLVELGQTDWPLSFEAEDDYGLDGALLRIQLAKGSGENIKFSEQTRSLTGQGSRTRKRFAQSLDLTALGIGPGDDVIVQFSVSDQRSPQNNTTRSSSFILRWPAEDSVEATGVEGLVQKAIPAYFRSQRQIIIDTEKLLADKRSLPTEKFAIQSDTIGVDQRILRLRYGQFLGEEAEGEHEEHGDEAGGRKATVSDTQAIVAEFGHTHDIPEAATLLEPKTKELLRSALNEMWQAELHLRSAQPKLALPYEYRALAFIKKVQQADRIYLARVGLELPPIDETRRLSGDRSSLRNRNDVLQAANNDDLPLIQFWHSLSQLELGAAPGKNEAPDFNALRNWMREHPARSSDSLGLLAALDALEKRSDCHACLLELKAALWPMLPKPPANPAPRRIPDPTAQKYLDALRQEHQR
ncbi:MAG TPA: hypothetical protein PLS60_02050 [Arenimonas sp.]|nr:hypothetical protein [Arenimonas sp.]HPO23128.1 hypothetical protein [Arenimonas sp.]